MDTDEGSVQNQREFVTSALLGRLSDDDPSVVLAVLNLKAQVHTYSYVHASLLKVANAMNIDVAHPSSY